MQNRMEEETEPQTPTPPNPSFYHKQFVYIHMGKLLFPPPFYFVFYISNLLSYIQNNFKL